MTARVSKRDNQNKKESEETKSVFQRAISSYKQRIKKISFTFKGVSSLEKVLYTVMNTVASSRNLRPNGLKTDRVLQFLVGLVVCIWLVYQITHLQLGSVRTKISENVVNSLGRKETSGHLNARGENLKGNIREGEMVEGENIQVDLQGGKRVEIAYSDETNKNDEGSSSKVSEISLETAISYRGSDGKDVLQDKDEPGIDQEGEENSATQNATVRSQYDVFSDSHSFHDENGIPKEMRDGKSAGSSSLNDQSESS